MSSPIVPVILSGGSGSRLWPLSRTAYPKQFLSLGGDCSLFQQSVARITSLVQAALPVSPPIVVTNEEHRFLVADQLKAFSWQTQIVLEPTARNTAPALTLAALAAAEQGDDPILVVTPSDHLVADNEAFVQAVCRAVAKAEDGSIVILGVTPDKPETAYGYIQAKAQEEDGIYTVAQFVEKPDAATAEYYLGAGCFYWNAGLFILKASTWLKAIEQFREDIFKAACTTWRQRSTDQLDNIRFIRPDAESFAQIPSESIDYAVMEPCAQSDIPISMVALDAGWSDLGSWDAVWQSLPKNENGNAIIGDGMAVQAQNNLIYADRKLVSVVGVDNLIVVETADAVLITDHAHSQNVKQLVGELEQQIRPEAKIHRKVYRPWGWYDSVDEDERFKVKRIGVNVGASLSLQKHYHRAEHWIVVKGTAEVTRGDEVILLTENQSVYIPLGEKHRLHNVGRIPLELIEVQTGSYLEEDDIVRYQDNFGRC